MRAPRFQKTPEYFVVGVATVPAAFYGRLTACSFSALSRVFFGFLGFIAEMIYVVHEFSKRLNSHGAKRRLKGEG